jgi:alpha/beta superfamily hydrolase
MSRETTHKIAFRAQNLLIEGILHDAVLAAAPPTSGVPGAVVCHPHPLMGGDINNNVVLALCDALAARGFAALRFNFRGVGRSEGEHGGGRDERFDVAAALAFLAAQPGVHPQRLFLAGYSFGAAVVLTTEYPGLAALAAVSPPLTGGLNVSLSCPTLLVFGDADRLAPASALDTSGLEMPQGSRVIVIPGADHFWWGHEDEMTGEVVTFFRSCLAT